MATATLDMAREQISDLVHRWAEGARAGDLDKIMSCYAPDVVAFDAVTALQFKGREAYRDHWEYCMGFAEGDMIMEVHELTIAFSGDVAFAHFINRCGCVGADGKEQVGWMRATMCFRRTEEAWRIVHEHHSMPFDPQTGKMLGDLQP